MVRILNIHTATETALINLTEDGRLLGTFTNSETKQHAAVAHLATRNLLQEHGIRLKDLAAIGVTTGPGSYTGIRVGLATAQGLAYALNVPLILWNSLEVMAMALADFAKDPNAYYSPMIDARRMEVYTAVYDYNLEIIVPPSAIILSESSFGDFLLSKKVFFSGSGSNKFHVLSGNLNSVFPDQDITHESLAKTAWKKYLENDFKNVPYAQPLYIK